MSRREFSSKVKLAAFGRANKRCEGTGCGALLTPGRFHYDHEIPDWMGGEPTLDNCKVLCIVCHGVKTATKDTPAYAKSQRIQKRVAGIKKPSKFRTSKDGPYKQKMDGTLVWRSTGEPVHASRER